MALIWSFGGTLLSTYGRVTLINDYLDLPERRGENMTLPYRTEFDLSLSFTTSAL